MGGYDSSSDLEIDKYGDYKRLCNKLNNLSHIAENNYQKLTMKARYIERELDAVEKSISIKYNDEQNNKQKLNELNIYVDSLNNKIEDLNMSISNFYSEINQLNSSNHSYKFILLKFITLIYNGMSSYFEKIKDKISERNNDIKNFRSMINNINREVKVSNVQINSLKKQQLVLRQSIVNLETKKKYLKLQVETMTSQINEWNKRNIHCRILADGIDNIINTCNDGESIEFAILALLSDIKDKIYDYEIIS